MKHTPGPWEYRPAMHYSGYCVAPLGTLPTLAACERFGESMTITCFNFPGSTEANARLMAAAPDMLEALEAIEARLNGDFESPSLLKQGQLNTIELDIRRFVAEAIVKAKGE